MAISIKQQQQAKLYAQSHAANTAAHQTAAYAARPISPLGTPPPKGQGIPAPQTPAGGGAAAGSTPPIDPALQGLIAGINKNRDTNIGQLQAQLPQVLADYGYKNTGYDQVGAPTGLTFDASNPFSRAALALRNYNQHQAGTTNSMAARGQLYSGALNRQKASNEFGYTAATDALLKALTGSLTGINQRIAGARTGADSSIAQAILNRAPSA